MRTLSAVVLSLLLFAGLVAAGSVAQAANFGPADILSGSSLNAAFQWGAGVPGGPYQQSCQDIHINGDRLEARCQTVGGGWRNSSIDYRGCRGNITNDDGNLRCDTSGRWQGGSGGNWQGRNMPRGSYQDTCRNINMNGNRLTANCQRHDGGWRDTSIDMSRCRNGQVTNDNGTLRCDTSGRWPLSGRDRDRDDDRGGNWQGRNMPPGSYQDSCRNINVNGNRLSASCQRHDGSWRDSSIDMSRCSSGQVTNDNGTLRCSR